MQGCVYRESRCARIAGKSWEFLNSSRRGICLLNWGNAKHPLAVADDRQERPGPFVAPVAGERIGGLV